MLWNIFTALHLTLASKICCLKGIALQFCQDDKYSFVVVICYSDTSTQEEKKQKSIVIMEYNAVHIENDTTTRKLI